MSALDNWPNDYIADLDGKIKTRKEHIPMNTAEKLQEALRLIREAEADLDNEEAGDSLIGAAARIETVLADFLDAWVS